MRVSALLCFLCLCLTAAPAPAAEPRAALSLNGKWRFRPLALGEEVGDAPPKDGWITTRVPAQRWPRMDVQRAWYRRPVKAPKAWQGRRVFLRFEAVAYRCEPWIDGRRAGAHLGGFTPCEFEITRLVKPGRAFRLDVFVEGSTALVGKGVDKSKLRSVHDAPDHSLIAPLGGYRDDQYRGIWQDVTLLARPRIFIRDVFIQPSVEKKRLSVRYELDARGGGGLTIGGNIFPPGGAAADRRQPAAQLRFSLVPPPGPAGLILTLRTPFPDAHLWSPESPFLYTLVSELRRREEVIDRREDRFGFREFMVEGDHFLLNGRPINLRCRGDSQTVGRTLYDRDATRAFLKRRMGNANIYRTHIAPQPRACYEVASELGLLMVAESELCFNYKFDIRGPEFWRNCARLLEERVRRDRNEPSIVIWSLENEVVMAHPRQKVSEPLWMLGRRIRFIDRTRPVMFEGDGDLRNRMTGASEEEQAAERGKPVAIVNLHPYNTGGARQPPRHWMNTTDVPNCYSWPEWAPPDRVPTFWGLDPLPKDRPWYMGEFGHAISAHPDALAFLGGNAVYRDLFGPARAFWETLGDHVAGQVLAYRRLGMSGVSPWWDIADNERTDAGWQQVDRAFAPVRMALRSRCTRLFADDRLELEVALFHDAPEAAQLTLVWQLGAFPRQEQRFRARPGEAARALIPIGLPAGHSLRLDAGGLTLPLDLRLFRNDHAVHRLTQIVKVYPRAPVKAPERTSLLLFDPAGTTAGLLRKAGLECKIADDLAGIIPGRPHVVLVGEGAAAKTSPAEDAALRKYLTGGGRVLCFRQTEPVRWLPVRAAPLPGSESTIVFPRHPAHPALAGLAAEDLRYWRDDHFVSRGNFEKSSRGNFRAVCDAGGLGGLRFTPLLEINVGDGVALLCQMEIIRKLEVEPVARIVLGNLLRAAARPLPPRNSELSVRGDGNLRKVLDDLVGKPTRSDLLGDVVLIQGGHLADPERLRDIVRNGKTLILHDLGPQDAKALRTLLDLKCTIRESLLEHPQLELEDGDPLAAGLTHTDLLWLDLPRENALTGTFANRGPIVRHIVELPAADHVKVLAREAPYTVNPGGGGRMTAGQYLARTQGKRIRRPGAALARVAIGKGVVVIDQILWDEKCGTYEKAARIASRLLDNLGVALRRPQILRLAASAFQESALKFRRGLHVSPPRVSLWCANDSVAYHLAGLEPGRYILRIEAGCASNREQLRVQLDGREVHVFTMRGPRVYAWDHFRIPDRKPHRLTLSMPKDVGDIFLDAVEIERVE